MNAGKLRDLVTVQENIGTQNSQGEVIASWVDLFTIAARVIENDGREGFNNVTVAAEVNATIYARYRTGIKAKHRALCGTDIFDIEYVVGNYKKNELKLLCKKQI